MRKYYRAKPNGQSYPSNSEPPFHKVTHRHDKSIPGCTLAPREGIYRPQDIGEAIFDNVKRACEYADDVQRYIRSEIPKEDIFKSFERPIFGAFGERL